ncbi:hypothetical protein SBRCBS47491_007954 [Sporothrix bragantina]|uniref:Dipeptidyl-peptidase V n=1 Tax=Sporothrix bragantina TaxID=671064 RepID=A0ABP0CKD7_9PEZI
MATASTTPRTLLENILDTCVPATLRVSPDGKQVVYSTELKLNHKKGDADTSALWIADTTIANSSRPFTSGQHLDSQPEWSPQNKSIAFVSTRGTADVDRSSSGNGNSRGRAVKATDKKMSAIYLQDRNGTQARKVVADDQQDFESIAKIAFSADESSIAFIAALPTQRKDDGDDAIVWGEGISYQHLWLVNVASGQLQALFNDNVQVADFAWTDSGDEVAIVTQRSPQEDSPYLDGTTVSLVRLSDRRVRPFFHVPRIVLNPVWLGTSLYFIGKNIPTQDTSGFAVFCVSEGQNQPVRVAQGEVDCAAGLVRVDDDVAVHVEHGYEDHLRLVRTDKVVVAQNSLIVGFHTSGTANNLHIVLSRGDVNTPTELFSYNVGTSEYLQLSDHGRNVSRLAPFGECHYLATITFDNKEVLDNLFLVPAQHDISEEAKKGTVPKTPLGTFVHIHGGPYGRRTDSFDQHDPFYLVFPLLLRQGYGILVINYRGSSGRVERFANYSRGAMGTVDEQDIIASVQHAIERGYADPKRLVAGGWSQGGFLSYISAVRNGAHGLGWRFSGLIAGAGVTDWDGMVLSSDVGAGYESQLSGGAPWKLNKDEVHTRSGSPLWEFRQAAKDERIPPMLMLHGEKDERVPISQAVGFQRALDSAGLPFTFVTYPRERHSFRERRHIEDVCERILKFVGAYLP